MEYKISDYVTVWQKYNLFELSDFNMCNSLELVRKRMFGDNPTRVCIKEKWYDVIPLYQVARMRSKVDGRYHFIYIQINQNTKEYYIGKVNRKRWSELKRYQGSGLRFKNKYKEHKDEFERYYIVCCLTAEETEIAEAEIVDKTLLEDIKCLNLVQGGGGVSGNYDKEKRSVSQQAYMIEHPENYQAMLEVAKQFYQSGETDHLRTRNASIKATMNTEHYREMTRERIQQWKSSYPEEYKKSRENNKKSMQNPETKKKRKQAYLKWIDQHPEEYEEIKKKRVAACQSAESREKRTESLKRWNLENPEQAKINSQKRTSASVEKCRKPVNMCDLETGEVIRTFKSQHEAAQWLVDNGLAKNTNCISSINAVCQKKMCSTGYGYRKKAYGYDWKYVEQD